MLKSLIKLYETRGKAVLFLLNALQMHRRNEYLFETITALWHVILQRKVIESHRNLKRTNIVFLIYTYTVNIHFRNNNKMDICNTELPIGLCTSHRKTLVYMENNILPVTMSRESPLCGCCKYRFQFSIFVQSYKLGNSFKLFNYKVGCATRCFWWGGVDGSVELNDGECGSASGVHKMRP